MKNYILIGLAIVLGGVAGYFIRQPKHTVEYLPSEKTVTVRDTCIGLNLIADITTESTTTSSYDVKKGKKTTETSDAPVTEVTKKDSIYTTVLSKNYDFGLAKFTVTTTVKAKSAATAKFSVDYQIDTLVLKELTHVNTVAIVSKDTTDQVAKEIIKYVPIESQNARGAYLGLSGGMLYTDKVSYQAGFNLSGERLGMTLYTTPTAKEWKHVGIQLNTKLVKLKK